MITLPVSDESKYTLHPSKIIALGLNYRDHIQESVSVNVKGFTKEVPSEPVLFPKLPSSIIGPGDTICIPAILSNYNFKDERTDYEGELAVIIGKNGKNIPEEGAYDYIFGYTCLNDVSQRNIQTGDKSGWFRGKSFDTFCPAGPCIVKQNNIKDPQQLSIKTRLNGKTVQQSNTANMIFGIPQILSFISKNFTLCEGDIISTGTPSGVGPIRPGDVVEVEIEEIGILKNPVA